MGLEVAKIEELKGKYYSYTGHSIPDLQIATFGQHKSNRICVC